MLPSRALWNSWAPAGMGKSKHLPPSGIMVPTGASKLNFPTFPELRPNFLWLNVTSYTRYTVQWCTYTPLVASKTHIELNVLLLRCEVFCALVVTAKRSVDELFMHYFHNQLSTSEGFAPRPPPGLDTWPRWRIFVPRFLIYPPLQKVLRVPMVKFAGIPPTLWHYYPRHV